MQYFVCLVIAALVLILCALGLRCMRALAGLRVQAARAQAVPWLLRVSRVPVGMLALLLGPRLPQAWRSAAQRALERADLDAGVTPEEWLSLHLLLGWGALLVACGTQRALDPAGLMLAVAAGLGSSALPSLWLRDRTSRRQAAVLRELPGYLEMLTLALEAGCAFGAALRLTTDRAVPSPLRGEFERCQQQMRAGCTRREALQNLERRLAMPAMSAAVAAILQADATGVSLAPVMRAQAVRGTQERFARAEKLAMEAPVKMLGPLVLCIFPCTFIVVGFPIAATLFWGA
jgi:tight adherence protein C